MPNILLISKDLHNEASELLLASRLLKRLEDFGETYVTGSFKYDLMTVPDIDIYVALDDYSRSTAVSIHNQLISDDWWNGFAFFDWSQDRFRLPKWQWLPTGYYLKLNADFGKHRWKIDVWLMNRQEFAKRQALEPDLVNLSSEQRSRILQLKTDNRQQNDNTTSHDIYNKVINSVD